MGKFFAGYISGIATAGFFVLSTVHTLDDFKQMDEFLEWKAERDKDTVETTAREITTEA